MRTAASQVQKFRRFFLSLILGMYYFLSEQIGSQNASHERMKRFHIRIHKHLIDVLSALPRRCHFAENPAQ